jgi:hypothetical protein
MAPAERDADRAHERMRVLSGVQAFEVGQQEPLGLLEDLSLGGFRLLTPKVIAVGVRKQLRVPLPAVLEAGAALEFEAECRWLRANAKGPGFQCGFEFGESFVAGLQPVLSAILHKLR